jgi:branched-chain amino acid transport system ATP-binding protein
MLEVSQLAVTYGQHRALKGVALGVKPGEIVVILGANGAGKTSLLKAVAGMIPAEAGSQVRLDGHGLSGQPPHRIVEAGLALVPEGRGIFGDLSVRENLLLGAFAQRARADQQANLDRVLGLFPKLAERTRRPPKGTGSRSAMTAQMWPNGAMSCAMVSRYVAADEQQTMKSKVLSGNWSMSGLR